MLDQSCSVILHGGKIRVKVRVRVRVFHRTFYSAPHGSTTIIRFSCKMQLSAHVLGLGLGLFIILFIVRHMVAQQLLDLVANATTGPCFRVRVRVFHQTIYSAPHGGTTMVRFSCKCNCWPMS